MPFFILLAMVTALGVGLWLSALNVEYRDVRYAIPFLLQFWLFATPIAYSSTIVPERWLSSFCSSADCTTSGAWRKPLRM